LLTTKRSFLAFTRIFTGNPSGLMMARRKKFSLRRFYLILVTSVSCPVNPRPLGRGPKKQDIYLSLTRLLPLLLSYDKPQEV
jgi:hypothetical protein